MKLSDEQIEQCRINAKASWNRHRFSIRGQQITPADDYEWHFIYWIESTVRQDAEQVVRELVVVLQACNAAIVETKVKLNRGSAPYGSALQLSTKCEAAITRAQQWLDLSHPR